MVLAQPMRSGFFRQDYARAFVLQVCRSLVWSTLLLRGLGSRFLIAVMLGVGRQTKSGLVSTGKATEAWKS